MTTWITPELAMTVGAGLCGLSYILNGYLREASWKYITKERNSFPWLLSLAHDGSLILGCVIILGLVGHLVVNGGNV